MCLSAPAAAFMRQLGSSQWPARRPSSRLLLPLTRSRGGEVNSEPLRKKSPAELNCTLGSTESSYLQSVSRARARAHKKSFQPGGEACGARRGFSTAPRIYSTCKAIISSPSPLPRPSHPVSLPTPPPPPLLTQLAAAPPVAPSTETLLIRPTPVFREKK